MGKKAHHYSARTTLALNVLASLIKASRKRKGWSEAELAERCATTRATVRKVEQGHPGTQIGTYFEIAHLLGIPLLADNNEKLSEIQMRVDQDVAVLPQRMRKGPAEVIDDF